MNLVRLVDLLEKTEAKREIIRAVVKGAVFIYPTDTVYGFGCNAEDKDAVERIRWIKQTDHPFSVIAPSKKWIKNKLDIKHPQYLKKLPGPYTLIFKKKRNSYLSSTNNGNSLGVRIPNHPFSKIVSEFGRPFITTSANKTKQPTFISPKEIPDKTLRQIDFIIDAGTLSGKPSTVFDLTGEEPNILRQ